MGHVRAVLFLQIQEIKYGAIKENNMSFSEHKISAQSEDGIEDSILLLKESIKKLKKKRQQSQDSPTSSATFIRLLDTVIIRHEGTLRKLETILRNTIEAEQTRKFIEQGEKNGKARLDSNYQQITELIFSITPQNDPVLDRVGELLRGAGIPMSGSTTNRKTSAVGRQLFSAGCDPMLEESLENLLDLGLTQLGHTPKKGKYGDAYENLTQAKKLFQNQKGSANGHENRFNSPLFVQPSPSNAISNAARKICDDEFETYNTIDFYGVAEMEIEVVGLPVEVLEDYFSKTYLLDWSCAHILTTWPDFSKERRQIRAKLNRKIELTEIDVIEPEPGKKCTFTSCRKISNMMEENKCSGRSGHIRFPKSFVQNIKSQGKSKSKKKQQKTEPTPSIESSSSSSSSSGSLFGFEDFPFSGGGKAQ